MCGTNPVTALLSSLHTDRVSVVVEETLSGKTETITTTLEHPFYVEGKGFLPAEELKAGMALSQWQPKQSPLQTVGYRAAETSGALLVKAITVERTGVPSWRAYNLTIANDHTYYVGHLRTWVHNASPCDSIKAFNPYGSKTFKSLSPAEQKKYLKTYYKQLKDQEDAVNSLTPKQYLDARDLYRNTGRNPKAAAEQQFARDRYRNKLTNSISLNLRKKHPNMSRKEIDTIAQAKADNVMKNLAALHNPDMVAGGYAKYATNKLGDKRVNSAIGGAWSARLKQMDNIAKKRSKAGEASLNFRFDVRSGPRTSAKK